MDKFRNFPVADFSNILYREASKRAIKRLENKINSKHKKIDYPSYINGEIVNSYTSWESINPSKHKQTVGEVGIVHKDKTLEAINAAKNSFNGWRKTAIGERAEYLFHVADQFKAYSFDLASLICLEAGKTMPESHADVAEAIDFLNFYGMKMKDLNGKLTQKVLGENNYSSYVPKGVVGVIAPWNFPLAILTGMTSAALVSGNSVVMKPAPQTPLIGGALMKAFHKAGLPKGVLNYVVGDNQEVGGTIVDSLDINMIAFTGSRKVGLDINEKISRTNLNSNYIKTGIFELGGKNGIIIDKTADFDEAIPGVLYSAFGFSGQKCSACSRAIVLEDVYDSFLEKLVNSTESLVVGEAKNPETDLGPVIDKVAFDRILNYLDRGVDQGAHPVFEGIEDGSEGYFIGPQILEIDNKNILAKEEVFGPVLGVIKVKDFEEAIGVLNSTNYALTSGIYSRTPSNIDSFLENSESGNRYVNRAITGAVVERQPFGGFKLSGKGSKAGSEDYLKEFMYQVTNSINTKRSGHIEGIEDYIKDKDSF